jgi:hypothetical protein
LLSSTHLYPHFIQTHSVTLHHFPQTSIICIKTLNFFHRNGAFVEKKLLRLEPSVPSTCFVGRFNHNFFRHKGYFFAAFGAFTIISLNYLVWRFQFCAFVENKTAFFANYLLRQGLTAVLDRNTIVTSYLYITTKRRSALEWLSIFAEHISVISTTNFLFAHQIRYQLLSATFLLSKMEPVINHL